MNLRNVSTAWALFKEIFIFELVPAENSRRAIGKLKKLRQITSAEQYLTEFGYEYFLLVLSVRERIWIDS